LKKKNVVGFDIVELCPDSKEKSSDFLAAKLYYKMLSYKFLDDNVEDGYESNFKESGSSINKFSKFEDDDEN